MNREERREERRRRWEDNMGRWGVRYEQRGDYGQSYGGKHGHIWTGIFLLLIGIAALLKASGIILPFWLYTWQAFLIALGVFMGLKHGFRGNAWFVLILLGSIFLLRDFYPELAIRRYFWPVGLILLGIFVMIRPRRRHLFHFSEGGDNRNRSSEETSSNDDYVTSTSIFGGCKKNVVSKNFKGGDIVNVFGGTELNLTQADIAGRVPLEMTTIFGGTKLIVPPNWGVQSDAITLFGGLEDKRPASPESSDKVLVLKGTIIFGGIEIKSY